ncbi:hypothetical protein WME79_03570 [Sorangium sp. So ce726]|uniref:hypothetical protein n=1 Tax=Sorangium sp. So ce726 TaxID=3133319 RepID=UPI003F631B30
MSERDTTASRGYARLAKTALIGGAIGGLLTPMPSFHPVWVFFYGMLPIAGVWIGLWMYLRKNPGEKLSNGDAAVSGAISGGLAGFIALGIHVGILLLLERSVRAHHPGLRPGPGLLSLLGADLASPVIYAGWGALGGLFGIQLVFKSSASQPSKGIRTAAIGMLALVALAALVVVGFIVVLAQAFRGNWHY